MENFITGFAGHEAQHRAAMRRVLGQEKYEFFFDEWLEYFFTEADAKFFAELGLNCLRLPFNYRHFEDDMNPRVLKESGFKHLDRVVDLVSVSHNPLHGDTGIRKWANHNGHIVRSTWDLYHPGHARRPRRPEPRLALRQSYWLCCFLGLQGSPGPDYLALGADCHQVQG